MICKKCNKNEVGDLIGTRENVSRKLLIYCRLCREYNRPNHLPDNQYTKYWKEFSKKYNE